MAAYTRTISRTVTNAQPAWRSAMTATDRIYWATTTEPWHAPALSLPTRFGYGDTAPNTFGAGWFIMSGYASGLLLDDVGGPHGTMVYGSGGHKIIANQILGLNLNQSDPTWSWWHQPTYKASDTGGANLYYAPSEASALIAGPRGTAARILSTDAGGPSAETTSAAAWDRAFPVAFEGWIFPRKLVSGQMGDNVPHGFRYSSTAYVPASVTGTDPMFFTITSSQGPFDQNAKPAGVSDSDWFDSSALVGGVGARKHAYYFRNCRTGAWTEHQWQPDGMSLAGRYDSPSLGVFRDTRRIYVVGGKGGVNGFYYIDMAPGFAGHTVSSYVGAQTGGGLHLNINGYCAGAFSEGDPLGRHFMVTVSNDVAHLTKLVVYDFDANTSFHVDLSSYGFAVASANDERIGISFDAVNRRIILLMAPEGQENAPFYWSIAVPSTLSTTPGDWSASKRFLAFDDPVQMQYLFVVGQSNQDKLAGFYGKTRLHPTLGIVLIPSGNRRQCAFIPSV